MSDDKKPPAVKRVRVMFRRDGVSGEADKDGRTRKHVMGDVAEFNDDVAKVLVDREWARIVPNETPLTSETKVQTQGEATAAKDKP